jgi:hypothetical protein
VLPREDYAGPELVKTCRDEYEVWTSVVPRACADLGTDQGGPADAGPASPSQTNESGPRFQPARVAQISTGLDTDCAESVKANARVCRYCGFRFAPPPESP